VIKAFFVPLRGPWSRILGGRIPGLSTSWCSISLTVWTDSGGDQGCFLLRAAINWSRSSRCIPAVYFMVNWQPFTMVWIKTHLTACCLVFLLLPVLHTIFKFASSVIYLVAALAALRWTTWCLGSCYVPIADVFDKAPANRLDFDPIGPGWGSCVSMIYSCGIVKEDHIKKKLEVLKIIWFASCQNGITSCQHVRYTEDESYWLKLGMAGISHSPNMCSMSVQCCLFVDRDKMQCMTADITWVSAIYRILFQGKDVCWCLSQIIPAIIHETDTKNKVIMYV